MYSRQFKIKYDFEGMNVSFSFSLDIGASSAKSFLQLRNISSTKMDSHAGRLLSTFAFFCVMKSKKKYGEFLSNH